MNVADCTELRDLLLFLNADLRDQDIPHRTKLTRLIEERYKIEYAAMKHEIQVCDGPQESDEHL